MKKIFLIIALLFSVVMTSQQQTSIYKWNAAITYNVNDLVSMSGIVYRATTSNTNDTPPSANWTQATELSGGTETDPVYIGEKSTLVQTTGAQSIAGIKTFTSPISGVDAVAASDLVTLSQVSGLGGGDVTAVNTPVLNDFARWTTGTSIEGRTYAETRTDLGLVIGTDVQAFSTILENTTASYTTTAASAIGINTAKETNATHTGDVTGATTLTIGADKILESHLKSVNAPTDEYALTYEATTGDFEWQVMSAVDLAPYATKSVDAKAQAVSYTTISADNGKHIDMSAGTTITLSDDAAAFAVDEQLHIFNNTGASLTFAYGTSDSAIQGTLPDLPDGQYAWCTLKSANTWSVIVGGAGGGGDVSKVGTPVNNEIAVWTGDGLLEGESELTYNGGSLGILPASGAAMLNLNPDLGQGTISVLQTGDYDMKFELVGTADYSFFAGATERLNISDTGIININDDVVFSTGDDPTVDFGGSAIYGAGYLNTNELVTGTLAETKANTVVFATAAVADITLTIPDTWTQKSGAQITIVNISNYIVTIAVSGTATLNGNGTNTVVLGASDNTGNEAVQFIQSVDGSDDWYTVGKY